MEVRSGNVAKLVNRLSRDLSQLSQLNKTTTAPSIDVNFRRSGTMATRSAIVRYSYKAEHGDELDLEVDDVIDVIEEVEKGWMKGKLRNKGRIGLFPTNFVHFIDKTTGIGDTLKSNDAKTNFLDNNISGDLSSEISTSRLSVVNEPSENRINYRISDATTLRKKVNSQARVLFTYSPKHEDELALHEVGQVVEILRKSDEDPGWLLAEIDGRQGFIPDNFVEILTPSVFASTINSETHKMSLPPNVPAKPASKPVSLSSSVGRRATTSSVFAQMHSSLADAFTKPRKQFTARAVKMDEGSAGEGQSGRLSHITATRPKQPNKRPPSTVFKAKTNEVSTNDETLMAESGKVSPTTSLTASSSNIYSQQSLSRAPSVKSVKVSQPLSPRNINSDISDEFVPRSEYNRLVQQFEELLTTMNKFRLEVSQKVSMLEAKIAKP